MNSESVEKFYYREDFSKIEEKVSSKDWLLNHPKIKNPDKIYKFEDLRLELLDIINNYKEKYLDLMGTSHWYWKSDLYNYFKHSIKSKSKDENNKTFWSRFMRNVIVGWLVFDHTREERINTDSKKNEELPNKNNEKLWCYNGTHSECNGNDTCRWMYQYCHCIEKHWDCEKCLKY